MTTKKTKLKKKAKIDELAKKFKIHRREIHSIVYTEHEDKVLQPDQDFVEFELNIPHKDRLHFEKLAKALKVSLNSVIVGLLVSAAEDVMENAKTKQAK